MPYSTQFTIGPMEEIVERYAKRPIFEYKNQQLFHRTVETKLFHMIDIALNLSYLKTEKGVAFYI